MSGTATPTPPPVFQTEVIVTAERGENDPRTLSVSTAVLTRREIEARPGATLAEAIEMLPGFQMAFSSGAGFRPTTIARGFFGGGEAEYVKLLVDGVPVGDAESGLIDWRSVPAMAIERVEALRGPSSARDITLTGENFETENPLTEADDRATTGAYKPFGTQSTAGEVIRGKVKCGGSIVRVNPDGSGFELVAWGLRNPFGVQFDRSGQLWTTNHGADVRGSRNVFNDPDYLVRVEQGAWYGFPEYFAGQPVTDARFNAPEKAKPTFLWREHPQRSDAFVTFASHAGTNGLAFSPGGTFGYEGDAFIAAFGTFAPVTTGINVNPAGFGVLRVDMKTREVHEFVENDLPGPAYMNTQNGGGGVQVPAAQNSRVLEPLR